MKDRQAPQTHAQVRIPVVSDVLHCISMTVIVYFRSGFGYTFLRPKSIFFAVSCAFAMFTVYACLEPGAWPGNAALCLFGMGAVILYALHLFIAFLNELRGTATHDNDSGTPHLLRLLQNIGIQPPEQLRLNWVLWAEPGLVLVAAILARWPLGAVNLSAWLILAAICLWLKEALNFWLQLRQRKRHRDAMEDAEEGLGGSSSRGGYHSPAPSRLGKVRRKRAP